MYLETNEAWHALNTQKAADFNINLVTYCTPPPCEIRFSPNLTTPNHHSYTFDLKIHTRTHRYKLPICLPILQQWCMLLCMFVGEFEERELCAGRLCRFAGLSHPQKHCLGEAVRHVNEHVRGCVLKLETDLCSVWDRLCKGHTKQASSFQ